MDIYDGLVSSEYSSSRKEMNRRKKAFVTLIICFYLSTCVFLVDYIILIPEIFVPILIILALIFIVLIVFFNMILERQSYAKIHLSESKIERKFKNTSESYALNDIESLRIKRTTKGLIREIKIGLSGSNFIFINGLEDFESFNSELVNRIKNIPIVHYKEFIDFDHPLYYVFFGTIVGITQSLLFRLIPLLDSNNIIVVQLFIACFIIILGTVWAIIKPIRGRYGRKNIITDYLFGLVLVIVGIIIAITSVL